MILFNNRLLVFCYSLVFCTLVFSACNNKETVPQDKPASSNSSDSTLPNGQGDNDATPETGVAPSIMKKDAQGRSIIPTDPFTPGASEETFGPTNTFEVYGTMKGGARGQIMVLQNGYAKDFKALFNSRVQEDETFGFTAVVDGPQLISLRTPNDKVVIQLIVRPGDKIILDVDLNEAHKYQVKGSPESIQLRDLYDILAEANEKKRAVEQRKKALNDKWRLAPDGHQKNLLRQEMLTAFQTGPAEIQRYDKEKQARVKNYISKIDTSFAGLLFTTYLSPEVYLDYLIEVEKKYRNRYKNTVFYKELKNRIAVYAPLTLGKIAPEIRIETPEGKEVRLSEMKNKIVLVHFWASWCDECRDDLTDLRFIYDKYKDKDFVIFSVALDEKKEQWVKAIADNNMPWLHGSDLQGLRGSTAGETYIVNALPKSFLLGKDNRIIGKNLETYEIERMVKNLVK